MEDKIQIFDKFGNVVESGFWSDFCVDFDKHRIGAIPTRIKEWDFYQFQTGDWVIQSTIANCLVINMFQAGLFNVRTKERYEVCKILPHWPGSLNMEPDPTRCFSYNIHKPGFDFVMSNVYGHRVISVKAKTKELEEFSFEVEAGPQKQKSQKSAKSNTNGIAKGVSRDEKLLILHKFNESNKMFYLNYKENLFRGTAHITAKKVGSDRAFNMEKDDLAGVLDWGRGYWPYNNEWYWGNYSGTLADGKTIGWNLGYGFGKCPETENVLYYDGKAYKLGSVIATINHANYKSPISIVDDNEKFRLTLRFVYDNYTETKILWYRKWCHQVWYEANGTVTAGDKKIEITNKLVFFEHEENHW